MSREALASQLLSIAEQAGMDFSAKFDMGADGVILLDGSGDGVSVSHDDGPADVTVEVTQKNLGKLLDGSLNATMAFMMKTIKIPNWFKSLT